ncbi:MBL fold metallo-hydrolase [Flavobacteriales bacterium]|nr:MBL fold metallo-hydrolase [Flavobacteriales bacterium]
MNGAEEKRLSRLVFLGTGTSQGVPIIGCHCAVCDSSDARDRRLRTSVALEGLTTRVVIDTGPDFRTQMLREGFTRLDAIVYTHEHKDHLAGMDDVRPFNYLQNKAMTLHASSRVETALRRDFHYAFEEHRHGGVPNVNIVPVTDEQPFKTGELTWMPIPVTHGKLPIHGFRVDNLAYITDASAISERAMSLLQDLEVLVLNALRPQPHYSHFSLSEALDVAQTLNANRTYLTHLSHLMGPHLEVGQALPEGVRLAHDGLVLERLETGVWQEKLSDWAQNANVL